MEQKIVLIGPQGVGKSQIFENLTQGAATQFVEQREATIAEHVETINVEGVQGQISDTSGDPRYRALISTYLTDATLVLIVIDHQTLRKEGGIKELEGFLEIAQAAGTAKVRIVVNKMDEDKGTPLDPVRNQDAISLLVKECNSKILSAITNIKEKCKEHPAKNITHHLPNDLIEAKKAVIIEEDVIYYSAKHQAEKLNQREISPNEHLVKFFIPIMAEIMAKKEDKNNEPLLPEIDWSMLGKELKPALPILGKGLLFLLMAAALTAVFIAIGAFIGGLAGAWSGPGAFFTAIGGAFAGAITAWNLSILIIAPVLGFSITGISFGLWHREDSPPAFSPGTNQISDQDQIDQSKKFLSESDRAIGLNPALTVNQSSAVIGKPPAPAQLKTVNNEVKTSWCILI